jgi:hypothetical protein
MQQIFGSPCRIRARPAGGVTLHTKYHLLAASFHRYGSIRFDSGTSTNPTRGCRYDAEPSRTEQSEFSLRAFSGPSRSSQTPIGGRQTTPTVTPAWQHRPRMRAIAMLRTAVLSYQTILCVLLILVLGISPCGGGGATFGGGGGGGGGGGETVTSVSVRGTAGGSTVILGSVTVTIA